MALRRLGLWLYPSRVLSLNSQPFFPSSSVFKRKSKTCPEKNSICKLPVIGLLNKNWMYSGIVQILRKAIAKRGVNTSLIKITWKKLIKQGAKDFHPVQLLLNDRRQHAVKGHSFPVTLN
ncbi:hypothetical protein V8G54_002725 [Vigna mungo]|uniref:Uncharacterized protein n=1 Tax=Vigna mungo TaxID=3915 RepID=A0AAQ3SCX3_VIGMU